MSRIASINFRTDILNKASAAGIEFPTVELSLAAESLPVRPGGAGRRHLSNYGA